MMEKYEKCMHFIWSFLDVIIYQDLIRFKYQIKLDGLKYKKKSHKLFVGDI